MERQSERWREKKKKGNAQKATEEEEEEEEEGGEDVLEWELQKKKKKQRGAWSVEREPEEGFVCYASHVWLLKLMSSN